MARAARDGQRRFPLIDPVDEGTAVQAQTRHVDLAVPARGMKRRKMAVLRWLVDFGAAKESYHQRLPRRLPVARRSSVIARRLRQSF